MSFDPTTTQYSGGAEISTSDEYLRKWTLSLGQSGSLAGQRSGALLVLTTEQEGYDLRMTFKIRHADYEGPGTAEITIYNLADSTAANAIKEYDTVTLQAGYLHGHYGIIFSGTIKQYERGREENMVDSYLKLFCADGDLLFNNSFINQTLPAGTTAKANQQAIVKALQKPDPNSTTGQLDPATPKGTPATAGGILPNDRSYVLYGMALDEGREYARTTGTTWSVQNGKIQNIKSTAYAQGDIVILNGATGMIGVPTETNEGIMIKCLLNPNLYIKGRVRINNADINQYNLPGGNPLQGLAGFPHYDTAPSNYATTSYDGDYCILAIDYDGDTRGPPWLCSLTCLAVDPTNPYTPVPWGQQS